MVRYGTSAYLLETHDSPYHADNWRVVGVYWTYDRALSTCVQLMLNGNDVHFPDDRSNPPRFRKTYD